MTVAVTTSLVWPVPDQLQPTLTLVSATLAPVGTDGTASVLLVSERVLVTMGLNKNVSAFMLLHITKCVSKCYCTSPNVSANVIAPQQMCQQMLLHLNKCVIKCYCTSTNESANVIAPQQRCPHLCYCTSPNVSANVIAPQQRCPHLCYCTSTKVSAFMLLHLNKCVSKCYCTSTNVSANVISP